MRKNRKPKNLSLEISMNNNLMQDKASTIVFLSNDDYDDDD